MKFTDGYWLMRPGVTARYAAEVADARTDEDRMTLYTPVKHVRGRGRGDTPNSPLLTVECWSPAEGVIGARATTRPVRCAADRSSCCPARSRAPARYAKTATWWS
jgi:hypothetical protein